MSNTTLTIQALRAAVAARQDTLTALRERIVALCEPLPLGTKLYTEAGVHLLTKVKAHTGASQWSSRTWDRIIEGWALVNPDNRLIAESLDCKIWDGSNMHYRSTEPTLLGWPRSDQAPWESDFETTQLRWLSGADTREIAKQLPSALLKWAEEQHRIAGWQQQVLDQLNEQTKEAGQ